MKKVELKCDWCGDVFERYVGELKRSLKKGMGNFCSRACSAAHGNASKKSVCFNMKCPICGKEFQTSTMRRSRRHCSRECASKGSLTEKRMAACVESGKKNAKNLLTVAEAMKRREEWKYAALREYLARRQFEFEFELGGFVFDLVLFDTKVLVEFDGKYHRCKTQKALDDKKDMVAMENGYRVERRVTATVNVISPAAISGL